MSTNETDDNYIDEEGIKKKVIDEVSLKHICDNKNQKDPL